MRFGRKFRVCFAWAIALAAITSNPPLGADELASTHLMQADALMAAGDFSDALLEISAAMKAAPDDPMLAVSAGNLIRELPRLRLCLLPVSYTHLVAIICAEHVEQVGEAVGVIVARGGPEQRCV